MGGRRSRAVAIAVAAAGLISLATATPGMGAVTLGPTDTAAPPSAFTGCGGTDCTFANRAGAGLTLTAPFDGVIVRWRIQTGTATATWRLRIVRQVSSMPALFSADGTGASETVVPGAERTFEAMLPVRAGDLVGVDGPPSATAPLAYRSLASGQNSRWNPPLVDGESPGRAPNGNGGGFVALYNADLEPDCDGDGFGDETQDPSLFGGSCALRGRTLTLDASKNKVKKGKKVTLSGRITEIVRQGECQAAQIVELQRKRPRQTTFTTVEQLQTDAAGSFSAKENVKKTFEYRAQVTETATCAAGLSNTEKVKVKKKT